MGRYRRFLTVGTYGTVGLRNYLRYLRYRRYLLRYGTVGTVPAISPKFYLSFTILVSFILVKYSDRIGPGPVNTVPTVPTVSTSPTGKKS